MENSKLYGVVIEKPGDDLPYEMVLEYYLNYEDLCKEYCDLKRYGITIKKSSVFPHGCTESESKTIKDIFYRLEDAEKFISVLIANKVTPTGFKDIVEEYIISSIR